MGYILAVLLLSVNREDVVSFASDFNMALMPYGDRWCIILSMSSWWVFDVQQVAPSSTTFSSAISSSCYTHFSPCATSQRPQNVVQFSTRPYRLHKPFSDVGFVSPYFVPKLIFIRFTFSFLLSTAYSSEVDTKDDPVIHIVQKYLHLVNEALGVGTMMVLETFPFRTSTCTVAPYSQISWLL